MNSQFRRRRQKPWYLRYSGILSLVVLVAAAIIAVREDLVIRGPLGTGVAHVIDGDSIRMGGIEYRLKGIDAPELQQTCFDAKGATYACGRLSKEALAHLIGRKPLSCENAGEDRYGRTLGYCRTGDTDLNRTMVEQGMAVSYRSLSYMWAEQEAKTARRGIWQGPFDLPEDWRNTHRTPRTGDMAGSGHVDEPD